MLHVAGFPAETLLTAEVFSQVASSLDAPYSQDVSDMAPHLSEFMALTGTNLDGGGSGGSHERINTASLQTPRGKQPTAQRWQLQ